MVLFCKGTILTKLFSLGSEEEIKDLKNAYLAGKGDLDYIVDHVQFARSEHEPRLRGILTVSALNNYFIYLFNYL